VGVVPCALIVLDADEVVVACASQRPYASARLRSRTAASSPTTWSSIIAMLSPTGSSGRRALMASFAAR
jgi:hypothetical protein